MSSEFVHQSEFVHHEKKNTVTQNLFFGSNDFSSVTRTPLGSWISMKMPQPFTHFPSFICMWGAISHNAVRAQPPFSCCILKIVKSCRSKSKFRRRVQMQLIAQNRKYFDVLLQILVIDSKLKGTYTLLMGLFPSCTDFWKIVYYWLFSRLYPCARTRDCARTRNL